MSVVSAIEIPGIQQAYGGSETIYLNGDASISNLDRFLDDGDYSDGSEILHFATHGEADSHDPDQNKIYLNDDEGSDLTLTGDQIEERRFESELAVLAACEVGIGFSEPGEGNMNISRSFAHAGVPRTISALWKVSDPGAADMVTFFYDHLKVLRLQPSSALRQAQLDVLFERDDIKISAPDYPASIRGYDGRQPFYWAAFRYYGDWQWHT